ncbi:hypothetical protein [Aquimarina mytili]|uniref:Uncharacterized protein n=1 Tax=Aquimarina mytili TaxID=874423 RepID=A0A937DBE0_9FLAO|nr:hypothetical protein [Aquimarina mytili]MBL0685647.1 hypothetical protein [Aquimarina mytili]
MFGRNRLINLFKEIRIHNFLSEKERNIKNKIGRYSEMALASLNVKAEIENLIRDEDLNVPKLQKEKTQTSITTEQMTGMQLPPGTSFIRGRIYDVEIANYTIPFIGNGEFFKCLPSAGQNFRSISVEKHQNSIIIKLTNWLGGISGNNEAIEMLKAELVKQVESIESVLEQLEKDIDEYKPILKKKIESELDKLIKQINIKNESNDKLNPFG